MNIHPPHPHCQHLSQKFPRKFKKNSAGKTDTKSNYNVWFEVKEYEVDDQYLQLYIPYDTFAKACKLVKSVYATESNDYTGYHNYMKYWAHYGDWNWICDTTEYSGSTEGMVKVINTYMATYWWKNWTEGQHPIKIEVSEEIEESEQGE